MAYIGTTDFNILVRLGQVGKYSSTNIQGYNATVGTTFEDVWAYSSGNLAWQTASDTYDVVSTDVNDTVAGTGTRTIYIEGLDNTGAIQTETINTSGTTPVTTANSYLRLNRATCIDNGTYGGSNLGDITISENATGSAQGFIPIGAALTQKSQYTVPLGYTAIMLSVSITVDSNKSTSVELRKRKDMLDVSTPFTGKQLIHRWDGLVAPEYEPLKSNHVFEALTDIWTVAKVNTGSAVVQTDYDLYLIQD